MTTYATTFGAHASMGQPRPDRHTAPAPLAAPTAHEPAPPGHAGMDPSVFDPIASHVRNQVVDRMVRMSVRHAAHAWQQRRARPVCPHAIAFLYAGPIPRAEQDDPQWFRVVAATRMVNDEPSVRALPRLLYRLAELARQRYVSAPGGFNPALQMSTYRDQASGRARYIGLGVSTLDTPTGSWEQVQVGAAGSEDVPGRAFALLADDTAMVLDRGAPRVSFGAVAVHSTGDLNVAPGLARRSWIHHPDVTSMPAPPQVWERMDDLHTLTLHQPRRPTL